VTALSLRQIVERSLADLGIAATTAPAGRPRMTEWLPGGHGIGLRRYASGRAIFVVQTTIGGRARTVTLGSAAVLSEAQAIAVGRRVLAHAIVGGNPADARARARKAPMWRAFVAEYWAKVAATWKPSTRKTMGYNRARHFDTAFAGKTIDAIDEPDVARWFARLSECAGPGAANRCIAILNAMMLRAELWGYRAEGSNPCRGIKRHRQRKGERFLSDVELGRLGATLAAARASANPKQAAIASAITLLTLTGCRRGEVLELQWSDVRGLRLLLRDSKTGPRTVWLGNDAAALIETLPQSAKARWLFSVGGVALKGKCVDNAWTKLRTAAGLADVRLHDLRHTFASHASMRAETLPMIGRLLGHAGVKSTARYARLDDDHLIEAAVSIGDNIAGMLGRGCRR